ncbi:MAG: phage major capsid protein [Clostridia bacterium]|nr:phage major capsid protein [Clostridia bacterium]
MAAFNEMITRTGAAALIPEEKSSQIIQGIVEDSAVLKLAKRLPNMSSKTLKMPVLGSLPYAYFVDGDTGMKQTTKVDWTNKIITAEEIAVIVPVADALLADAEYDIWAQIRPLVSQAFGQVIDNAILYGTNKPASWDDGIVTAATAKGNVVTATDDGFKDIMGPGGLISLVEEDGFLVNGYMGSMQSRAHLRGITDQNGQPLFRNGMNGGTTYALDGQRIEFPRNGSMNADGPLLIAGDWDNLVYSIRQDMTVTKTNTGVITDNDGKIIYNLYQQDMTALRFVMRLGWALPQAASALGATNPYPFAVLNKAGA